MPFRSEAQRKYMNAAAARGEINQNTVDEFNASSKGLKLPDRINPPKSRNSFPKTRKILKRT